MLAFVRRDGGEAIACVFNLSGEPRFVDARRSRTRPAARCAPATPTLRGGSIGLSRRTPRRSCG